ncbi:MAG: DNA polymerase III subunit beta [Clostridiales bacterium]|nr:DNA polymerase III subunit beta [Clostridiales bacterium]
MKFEIEKENLLIGINSTIKAVASKTTMPILECFLIEAKNNLLRITATDLDLGIEYSMDANIIEEGRVTIDAKMFSEIIRKLPENMITISLNEQKLLTIECEGSLFKLVTVDSSEFPALPNINIEQHIEIKQNILKEMIRKTIFAVGIDENRPIFTGCLMELKDNVLNMVALDGFRLAMQSKVFVGNTSSFKAIIPGRTLNEISKILQDDDEIVKIGVSRNQGLFEMANFKAVTRILEGEFLDYNNVIPKERELRVTVDKNTLINSLERAAVMSKEDRQFPIKVTISENIMVIACVVQSGDVREELLVESVGKNLEIGFNPKYLIEAVRAVAEDKINLDFGSSISPCVIRPLEGNEFTYMVLPVRI